MTLTDVQTWILEDQYPHGEWGKSERPTDSPERSLAESRLKPNVFSSCLAYHTLIATGAVNDETFQRLFHWLDFLRDSRGYWTSASGSKVPIGSQKGNSEVINIRHTAKALDTYLFAGKFRAADSEQFNHVLEHQNQNGSFSQHVGGAPDMWSTAYVLNLLIRAQLQPSLTLPRDLAEKEWLSKLEMTSNSALSWLVKERARDKFWHLTDVDPIWVTEALLTEIGGFLAYQESNLCESLGDLLIRNTSKRPSVALWSLFLLFPGLRPDQQETARGQLTKLTIEEGKFEDLLEACSYCKLKYLQSCPESLDRYRLDSKGHDSLLPMIGRWEVQPQPCEVVARNGPEVGGEKPPHVLISYSHDSDEHKECVLRLCERLRQDGVEAYIDQYVNGTPAKGWPLWMLDQLDLSDFVLIVCTETYYRRFRGQEIEGEGRGVTWEGAVIASDIYLKSNQRGKYIPIFLSQPAVENIPAPMASQTYYSVTSESDYGRLLAALFHEAGVEAGPVAARVPRGRRKGTPLEFQEPPVPQEVPCQHTSRAPQRPSRGLSKEQVLGVCAVIMLLFVALVLLFRRTTPTPVDSNTSPTPAAPAPTAISQPQPTKISDTVPPLKPKVLLIDSPSRNDKLREGDSVGAALFDALKAIPNADVGQPISVYPRSFERHVFEILGHNPSIIVAHRHALRANDDQKAEMQLISSLAKTRPWPFPRSLILFSSAFGKQPIEKSLSEIEGTLSRIAETDRLLALDLLWSAELHALSTDKPLHLTHIKAIARRVQELVQLARNHPTAVAPRSTLEQALDGFKLTLVTLTDRFSTSVSSPTSEVSQNCLKELRAAREKLENWPTDMTPLDLADIHRMAGFLALAEARMCLSLLRRGQDAYYAQASRSLLARAWVHLNAATKCFERISDDAERRAASNASMEDSIRLLKVNCLCIFDAKGEWKGDRSALHSEIRALWKSIRPTFRDMYDPLPEVVAIVDKPN